MDRYDLINPSDPYQFDAPDDAIAEAVAALLSPMCGWKITTDGVERQGGLLGLGGDRDDEIAALKVTLEQRKPEVTAALRSLEINKAKRERLDVDPDKWHDEERTSLNDYRASGLELAAALEATAPEGDPA